MTTKIEMFLQQFSKKSLPDLKPGNTVRVYQKVKEKNEGKTQTFEGLIIAKKHGKEMGGTITVRKIISGVGVERIFPLHSSSIEKIEILKKSKTRRAKLYYLRKAKGKGARLKKEEFKGIVAEGVSNDIPVSDAENETIITKEEIEKK